MDDVFVSNPPSPQSDQSSKPSCNENTVHLKLLIPSGAAGAIIGKDGRAITSIQQQTSTKVKVSKQNEFFPGTTERVCLVTGSIAGVLQVHQHIAKQIVDKKDLVNGHNLIQQRQAHFPFQNPHGLLGGGIANVDRTRQVKVLVPNSTAGMIIGKGGNYIRQLQQSTGATIQISQRSATPQGTGERCVTITGDLDACQSALEVIIGKLAEDPQASNLATFTNISYNGISPLSNSSLNPTALHPNSGLVARAAANAGASIMPLMSPASIPNFLLPALWNPNLLPYVLPRTIPQDGRSPSDFPQASNSAAFSNNSYGHLSVAPNGANNSNSSYNQSGLLATPSGNAAMLNSQLQHLWGTTPFSSIAAAAAAAAAANSGGTSGNVSNATGSAGAMTGSGSLMNHVEGTCAMKELLVRGARYIHPSPLRELKHAAE